LNAVSQPAISFSGLNQRPLVPPRVESTIYALSLLASIAVWFVSLRAPLWLDETFSFWQIKDGVRQILSRRGSLSPAYAYILWLFTRFTGTSEIGLRVLSILAMLSAVYLLYCASRELFSRDVALITAVLFCAHPLVIFTSIDARPYACAALAINSAIYLLVRLRHSNSIWLAAAFGVATAAIAYFQMVFGVIFPVLAVCLFLIIARDIKAGARQFGIAFVTFTLASLPNLPDLLHIFHARQMLVFDKSAPKLADLAWTLAPGDLVFILLGVALIAGATRKIDLDTPIDRWTLLLCASSCLVPIFILYGVTSGTATNVFVERYRLVAVPGIALAWGWILSRIDSRLIRVLFCVAVVSSSAYRYLSSPVSGHHGYTWKYALQLAEQNASVDHAPVLICSDFPNADYVPMPAPADVKASGLFTPLSYYRLSVPVVGLPRALNEEAMRVGSDFVLQARLRRQRFLALAWGPSYPTMLWLTNISADAYDVRTLGEQDGVVVLEFTPHNNDAGIR